MKPIEKIAAAERLVALYVQAGAASTRPSEYEVSPFLHLASEIIKTISAADLAEHEVEK